MVDVDVLIIGGGSQGLSFRVIHSPPHPDEQLADVDNTDYHAGRSAWRPPPCAPARCPVATALRVSRLRT